MLKLINLLLKGIKMKIDCIAHFNGYYFFFSFLQHFSVKTQAVSLLFLFYSKCFLTFYYKIENSQ